MSAMAASSMANEGLRLRGTYKLIRTGIISDTPFVEVNCYSFDGNMRAGAIWRQVPHAQDAHSGQQGSGGILNGTLNLPRPIGQVSTTIMKVEIKVHNASNPLRVNNVEEGEGFDEDPTFVIGARATYPNAEGISFPIFSGAGEDTKEVARVHIVAMAGGDDFYDKAEFNNSAVERSLLIKDSGSGTAARDLCAVYLVCKAQKGLPVVKVVLP